MRPVSSGRPFTGAWIETRYGEDADLMRVVAPSRGRGLKHMQTTDYFLEVLRRPFTGAWIETTTYPDMAAYLSVAPSRGRGLKLT